MMMLMDNFWVFVVRNYIENIINDMSMYMFIYAVKILSSPLSSLLLLLLLSSIQSGRSQNTSKVTITTIINIRFTLPSPLLPPHPPPIYYHNNNNTYYYYPYY